MNGNDSNKRYLTEKRSKASTSRNNGYIKASPPTPAENISYSIVVNNEDQMNISSDI